MKTLTITYPEKNLEGESLDVDTHRTEQQIIERWKKMYGQFFYKCKIEVVDDNKKVRVRNRLVKPEGYIRDIRTGIIYFSLMDAAIGSKRCETTIYAHCIKKYKNRDKEYDFEYV